MKWFRPAASYFVWRWADPPQFHPIMCATVGVSSFFCQLLGGVLAGCNSLHVA
jgi:hypothetical protein